jgi:hypothetical protein
MMDDRELAQCPLRRSAQEGCPMSVSTTTPVFPDDVYRPPESWARQAFPTPDYVHEVDKGGHFAAWEHPELFSTELRGAFRPQR